MGAAHCHRALIDAMNTHRACEEIQYHASECLALLAEEPETGVSRLHCNTRLIARGSMLDASMARHD